MAERLQFERRRDPYPWTWEPWLFAAVMLATLLGLGVQVGRGVANLLVGAGWTWPDRRELIVSVVGVVRGDSSAGLNRPPSGLAGARLLCGSLIVTEIAITATFIGLGYWVLRTWGPWRVLGMASKVEAERLLGQQRLRQAAPIVRPDLYGARRDASAHGVVHRKPGICVDATAAGERPLGFGLSLTKRHPVDGEEAIPGETRRWR